MIKLYGQNTQPIWNRSSIEDTVSSVNHVIVDRDNHHAWIKYDATNDTGVHSWVTLLGRFPFLLKHLEYLETFRVGLLLYCRDLLHLSDLWTIWTSHRSTRCLHVKFTGIWWPSIRRDKGADIIDRNWRFLKHTETTAFGVSHGDGILRI